jgi:putative ABC transport system permease protein
MANATLKASAAIRPSRRQGLRLALVGIAFGTLATLPLAHYMQVLVYGVKPRDPVVTLISVLTLGVVAMVACFLPAHRMSRIDPARILRSDSLLSE